MKILHVIPRLAERVGGPVTVVKSLVKHQIRIGLDATICTSNADYPKGLLNVETNVPVDSDGAKIWHFSINFEPILLSLKMKKWLQDSVRQFDIVHIHGVYRFPQAYAAWVCRKKGVPYIISPHGSLDPYLYDKSSRSVYLKRLFERLFALPNLHEAGAIHYTAEDERRLAGFLNLRAPSFIVPNGIDWTPFQTLPQRGAFRERIKAGSDPLVLYLGRLHHKKGLDVLVPAFDKVRRILPSARLAIVGPANDDYGNQVRAWVLQRGLQDAVTFIDFVSGPDLVQAYVDADVFVLPSYTENFGMTVVEAMACACPVIISRHVNIHEDVSGAGAGLVTDCDAAQVAQSILDLLNDPDRRDKLGQAGRSVAHERYAWPGIVDQLTDEYRGVIKRHKGMAGQARDL